MDGRRADGDASARQDGMKLPLCAWQGQGLCREDEAQSGGNRVKNKELRALTVKKCMNKSLPMFLWI
jgi:hypothetical protein